MTVGDPHHHRDLLSPLELHILDLCASLSAGIAALVDEDEVEYPLGEFDQRLLLEHTQLIERYILAQAGARAYPERFRQIGKSVSNETAAPENDGHVQTHNEAVHDHDHDHRGAVEQHLVTDPEAAREAHRKGRAVIGEHPWADDHGHGEDHTHADEWEWEPLDKSVGE